MIINLAYAVKDNSKLHIMTRNGWYYQRSYSRNINWNSFIYDLETYKWSIGYKISTKNWCFQFESHLCLIGNILTS